MEASMLVDLVAADVGLTSLSGELQRVCRAAARRLDMDGSAIRLAASGEDGIAASSDASARVLAELQFDANEGPGHQALAGHRPVLVADLQAGSVRWPAFALLASDHGLGSIFCFPLHEGAVSFGVLELYGHNARRLSQEEVSMAMSFARVATRCLLDGHGSSAPGQLEPGISSALERAVVYQAQGMVMVDLGVSLKEALARMRGRAFADGISLDQLARMIVDGRESGASWFDEMDGRGPSTRNDDVTDD